MLRLQLQQSRRRLLYPARHRKQRFVVGIGFASDVAAVPLTLVAVKRIREAMLSLIAHAVVYRRVVLPRPEQAVRERRAAKHRDEQLSALDPIARGAPVENGHV